MRLRHISLPGLVSYSHAADIQQRIVRTFLSHKANPSTKAPDPVIITAQFNPVYTCGRREIGTVTAEQQDFLRAGGKAEFFEALRGGQTTFHGPGQLVAYPIVDLRRHGLTPRTYVCLLEKTLIATCARYDIKAMTTENTGVWTTPEKKIAAIGVHLRRNITSHGIGLNVNTDLWWFNRIVACGLEGKKTTTFAEEGVEGKSVEEVGRVFTEELAGRIDAVESPYISEQEILSDSI
ncbi:lipoate-protein ligase-like protein B [Rhizodiscina lignyota]|uniref:Octanoyltransferase n=1 Tax=Rhizodiscina lignyota TaxID=1504668 RepID=A0A9P4IQ26_9PEZI|nr:lipoate-protein ligase-like protein B [Rhizodiscina lignyota]